MKKLLFLLAIVLIQLNTVAQNVFPRVEKITTNEKILHGYIAKKYPITIYLKVHKSSGFHTNINKLKGWYYYNNIKTKIPLVGVNGEELVLYQLKDENAFLNKDLDGWSDLEAIENISDYLEKFVISKENSKWFSKGKELEVSINNNNISISKENEYLRLSKERSFNLDQFIAKEFTLLYANENRFILGYAYNSKANLVGYCGAGNEEGYLSLVFDENGLKEFEEFPIESCIDDIYYKELNSNNNNQVVYEVFDSSDKISHKLIISKESVNIKKVTQ